MEKGFKLSILIIIVISLIYLAITNRYEVKPVGQGTFVIKHDKWTGQIFLFAYGGIIEELGGHKAGHIDNLPEK